MGRRGARDFAMKLLYQLEVQHSDRQQQVEERLEGLKLTLADRNYILSVIDGVNNKQEEIDKLIDTFSKGWKVERLSKVDLSILRLSIYEILYREDIPYIVSVNEAVELAKKYSGEDSGSFINGIRSKITKNDSITGGGNLEVT